MYSEDRTGDLWASSEIFSGLTWEVQFERYVTFC